MSAKLGNDYRFLQVLPGADDPLRVLAGVLIDQGTNVPPPACAMEFSILQVSKCVHFHPHHRALPIARRALLHVVLRAHLLGGLTGTASPKAPPPTATYLVVSASCLVSCSIVQSVSETPTVPLVRT